MYNKTISKMLHNLNMLYDSTIYIVSDEITGTGEYKYPGVRYVSEDEIKNLRIQDTLKDTMYIGVNELVSGRRSISQRLLLPAGPGQDLLFPPGPRDLSHLSPTGGLNRHRQRDTLGRTGQRPAAGLRQPAGGAGAN